MIRRPRCSRPACSRRGQARAGGLALAPDRRPVGRCRQIQRGQPDGGGAVLGPGFGQSTGVDFATSVNGGNATRWALGVKQPLLDATRSAQSRQLGIAADAAELEYRQGRRDWMLQLTQRYFELVLAERRLALLQQQHAAVERALVEARDRFAIGDTPSPTPTRPPPGRAVCRRSWSPPATSSSSRASNWPTSAACRLTGSNRWRPPVAS